MKDFQNCCSLEHLESETCVGIEACETMIENMGASLEEQQAPASHLASIVKEEIGLAHGVFWQTVCRPPPPAGPHLKTLKPDVQWREVYTATFLHSPSSVGSLYLL